MDGPSTAAHCDVASGSIRQRSRGSYEVRVYLGRDLLTGKERDATRTVRGDRSEAERVMSELVVAADAGATVASAPPSGTSWSGDSAKPRRLPPKTVKETRGYLDRTLLPGLGHLPLTKLGTIELDRFYTQPGAHGGVDGRALAPVTIRWVHGIVHRALGQGVRWGWLPSNPASTASRPAVPPPDITPPSQTQLAETGRPGPPDEP